MTDIHSTAAQAAVGRGAPTPDDLPPKSDIGALGWLRRNLFATPFDAVLTVLCLAFLAWLVPPILDWALFSADWSASNSTECTASGACWGFIAYWHDWIFYGPYPEPERWRLWIAGILLLGFATALIHPRTPHRGWIALAAITVFPAIAFVLLKGGILGLATVETDAWGGLMLTVTVGVTGIVLSLIFGILLAMGRRSPLPIVRALCTGYIEVVRAIPLLTVLFTASIVFPLVLPPGMSVDKVLRAALGLSFFWAAYMAESVRGGLQALPRGQYEAAAALNLGYWRSMGLVIMPQALKHSLPGIMNTVISLVKDTTLLSLIGLTEVLQTVQAAGANPNWLGRYNEGYAFIALIFFTFCFTLSRISQRLEKRLDTRKR